MGVSSNGQKNIILNTIIKEKQIIKELYSYENAICKIKYGASGSGIGFFCEINDDAIPFKKALFTRNHILNQKIIDINKQIKFEYCKEEKIINITKIRNVLTKKELDYTCIEIFDEDNIINFLKLMKILLLIKIH